MHPKLIELRKRSQKVEVDLQTLLQDMLSTLELTNSRPIATYSIYDKEVLVEDMRLRKKGISFEDLELQTGISSSTIKRMLKDPSKTSLENFLSIANELGMKIWVEEQDLSRLKMYKDSTLCKYI